MQPYNNYFPATYQPMPYPQYPQYPQVTPNIPQQPSQMNSFQSGNGAPIPNIQSMTNNQPIPNIPQTQSVQQPALQIQNGGFISVRSIDEVANWQVAPGNSITFFIEGNQENPPFICVKTKGFSQLEAPTTEVYDLVKRTSPQHSQSSEPQQPIQASQNIEVGTAKSTDFDLSDYAKISDLADLKDEFENVLKIVNKLRFDIDAVQEKSTKKIVQKARKEADEE